MPVNKSEFRQSVGLKYLGRQITRKVNKTGYDFSLMVCGESQLGKTTLINSLFFANPDAVETDDIDETAKNPRTTYEPPSQTVEIVPRHVRITEHGVNLNLTIIDTPGFGDAMDSRECWKPLADYIDKQYEGYMIAESKVDRSKIKIEDHRIHCLLYFINPNGYGLKQLDIEAMINLHQRINIVPLIAKADTLTKAELKELKDRILQQIEEHKIEIFAPGLEDADAEPQAHKETLDLLASIPLSVIGADTYYKVGDQTVRGRQYAWGLVEVDNEAHCDFTKLRKMLVSSHLHDLKGLSEEIHYERYRKEMLDKTLPVINAGISPVKPSTNSSSNDQGTDQETKESYQDMKRVVEEQKLLLEQMKKQIEQDKRRTNSKGSFSTTL